MSTHTDHLELDGITYSITRHSGGDLEGQAFGLWIDVSGDLGWDAFLTDEEALVLRDLITKHLDPTHQNRGDES